LRLQRYRFFLTCQIFRAVFSENARNTHFFQAAGYNSAHEPHVLKQCIWFFGRPCLFELALGTWELFGGLAHYDEAVTAYTNTSWPVGFTVPGKGRLG